MPVKVAGQLYCLDGKDLLGLSDGIADYLDFLFDGDE